LFFKNGKKVLEDRTLLDVLARAGIEALTTTPMIIVNTIPIDRSSSRHNTTSRQTDGKQQQTTNKRPDHPFTSNLFLLKPTNQRS